MVLTLVDSKISRSCDQCCLELRRCDKVSPVCSSCRLSNRECTKNKVTKYRATIHSNRTGPLKINQRNKKPVGSNRTSSGPVSAATRKKFKIIHYEYLDQEISIPSTTSLSQSNWDYYFKMCFENSATWYKFYYFSRVLGVSIHSSCHLQKIIVFECINNMSLPSKDSRVSLHLQHSPIHLENILNLAVESYFKNVNPFYPLFQDDPLKTKPRSHFLKASICRVGLQYLPKSSLRTDFISHLDDLLLSYIRPSKLKPSLDSLQSLLILVFGCHSSPLLEHRNRLFSIVISWVHLLGLESTNSRSLSIECQMALGLIHGFEFYFSNVINTIFLPPLSASFTPTYASSFMILYFQQWSIVAKEASITLIDSESLSNPDSIFPLLRRLDRIVHNITTRLKKINTIHHRMIHNYVILMYHFHYIALIDMVFNLNTTNLKKLDKQQISLLRRTGYVHSLLAIQKSIPIQNPAFVATRVPLLLKISKILNSWASPCPPSLLNVIKRNIIRTNCDSIRGLNDYSLEIVDYYFKNSSST